MKQSYESIHITLSFFWMHRETIYGSCVKIGQYYFLEPALKQSFNDSLVNSMQPQNVFTLPSYSEVKELPLNVNEMYCDV